MTEEKKDEKKVGKFVDLAGNAKLSSSAFANFTPETGPQGQPMQFVAMEVGKGQVIVDDPDGDGKIITQQPSGYVTLTARIMLEYIYDDEGKKREAKDWKPDPEKWESLNVVMYRRRKQDDVMRPQPAKKSEDKSAN